MAQARDWQGMKDMSVRLLKERTGEGVDEWNRRIKRERFDDEDELRAWLTKQGVTGYAQSLLVMERFGYPDFLLATADELIDGQYADRARSSGRSSTLSLTLRRVSARSQSRRARPMSHSSLLAGRSPGFKRRRRTASISVCGWKGGSPRGASSPRRFKRPCRFKLDSRHLMRWIQRCSVGSNKRMTRTADRAPNQSVRTNSFPSGSAIVAFQFPHGFFSGRSVTVPPFRSIARAARFTSSTEK